MDEIKKKVEDLKSKLDTRSNTIIINTISALRKVEPYPGVIGLLAALHANTTNANIKIDLVNFFNDLKEQQLADEVINAINASNSMETRNMLISSCWQSGLDYSAYFDEFIGYCIDGDYISSLESFTILEPLIIDLDKDILKQHSDRIKKSIDSQSPDKQKLLYALIKLLE